MLISQFHCVSVGADAVFYRKMREIVVKHYTSYQDLLRACTSGLLLPLLPEAACGIYVDRLLLAAGLNIC